VQQLARGAAICIADDATATELNSDPVQSMEQLEGLGVTIAGVTLGERGSIFHWAHQTVRVSSLKTDVRDTTGAGDVFHGAFLAAYVDTGDVMVAARIATAAAGLSVRSVGSAMSAVSCTSVREQSGQVSLDVLTQRSPQVSQEGDG
jgi:sugar/nucleoside kinase (ribokinase family)